MAPPAPRRRGRPLPRAVAEVRDGVDHRPPLTLLAARRLDVWLVGLAGLGLTTFLLVYAATRIDMPALVCTVPRPAANVAAWDAALEAVLAVVRVARWCAIAGGILGLVGLAVCRRRLPLLAAFLAYGLVVGLAVAYGDDIPGGACTS